MERWTSVMTSAAAAVGVDDFLHKPFGENELLARVRRLAGPGREPRRANAQGGILNRGRVRVDLATRQVTVDGVTRNLGPKRFELLCLLLRNSDGISVQAFSARGWDPGTLRKTVEQLRKDLQAASCIILAESRYRLVG